MNGDETMYTVKLIFNAYGLNYQINLDGKPLIITDTAEQAESFIKERTATQIQQQIKPVRACM